MAEQTVVSPVPDVEETPPARPPRRPGARTTVVSVLAVAAVWLALVLPVRTRDLTPASFVQVPLEGLLLVAVALLLRRAERRRLLATVLGGVLGVLLVVKALDLAFDTVFDRPFDLLNDWYYVGPGVGVLGDSIGRPAALVVVVAVALLAVAVVVGVAAAGVRVAGVAAAHRRASARALVVLATVWAVGAVAGLHVGSTGTLAGHGTADLAVDEVRQLRADLVDRKVFDREIARDPYASTPADRLLAGLRGKDVLVAVVESYGRVAVQGTSYSRGVDAVLARGDQQLRASGYSVRSAFLTSPTFGAGSWLAHASLQSGLWVDSQQRYNQLFTRHRLTLSRAFAQAGWRTIFDDPAITKDWPEGKRFYGFDQSYDSRNVGYRGPRFDYATMPDQYTLAALTRNEFTADPGRPRVMGEVDLVSSHHPWTPLPHLVPWSSVGDGSVFDGMPAQGESATAAFRDPNKVRALYGQSIEYTLGTLVSWLQVQPDPNLVLVVYGDHQPHGYVSGEHPGHDVPISVIARDPAVMDRIAGWGWQDGLRPQPDAPVWRMDTFRDRFFAAFTPAG
ncbi:CDP-alcohol phosphatidyltransferase family protein [Nocardioides pocheonensis]|uniref:CDP-alcohol phosphatidyltransferase family protein n=1 Tax=Nocardioides pocheonensis TaxID=661485 RepID=UPI001C82AF9B|nr:CDP-alcohol phosphatidyltransferase family protein [Nocardioides pocheonensis]